MDPVALFALIAQELAASGDTPLTASTDTVPAPHLTLRGAVQAILWVTNAAVDLRGTDGPSARPFPLSQADTVLGHLLSMRAEQLQTQALLSALLTAVAPQVDQKSLMASVKEQINA
jgi:hypothetical protein